MRSKYVMGNWKMHGSFASIQVLLDGLVSHEFNQGTVVIFPPAVYLQFVHERLKASSITLGAQNVYPAMSGAFTGELAGPMLKENGCCYVLVGHSERRHLFHESQELITQKFQHVKACGMTPVFCVGETLQEREKGQTEAVLMKQLSAIYEQEGSYIDSIVAYEPVWAIGTGQTALASQVQAAHAIIRGFVASQEPQVASHLPILYGGSLQPDTAASLFTLPDVDGGLVGGASLEADRFLGIVRCINSY